MTRPRIGITKPVRGDFFVYAALWLAVRLAGGRSVMITERSPRQPGEIDGLLLSGGLDLSPHLYEGVHDPAKRYDDGRDRLEMAWARHAVETGLPLLGICRGCQILNVARGGDLVQEIDPDLLKTFPATPLGYLLFRKTIAIEADSRLAAILGGRYARVNSLHRQAVNGPGEGLRVTAREVHGGVQAIEATEHRFCLGVQFHPELMIHRADMRALFRALVTAAGDR